MQQWIPRTQTLEPKIWGQVGLRQGLYLGLGVFAGIFFLVALAPLGLGPRVAGALLALTAGAVPGFMRIKGLSPERYLFQRLRFAMWRQGLGVWQAPDAPERRVQVDLFAPTKQREHPPRRAAAPAVAQSRRATQAKSASAPRWSVCAVQASPFCLGFYLIALGAMGSAIVYLAGRPIP